MKRNKEETLAFTLEQMNKAHEFVKNHPTATAQSAFSYLKSHYDNKFYYTIVRDMVECGFFKVRRNSSLKVISRRPFRPTDAAIVNAFQVSRAKKVSEAKKVGAPRKYRKIKDVLVAQPNLFLLPTNDEISKAIELLKANGYKIQKQDWITV
jgi:hypothetical protein